MLDDKTLGVNVKYQLNEISALTAENTRLNTLLKKLEKSGYYVKTLMKQDFINNVESNYADKYKEAGVKITEAMFSEGEKYNYVYQLREKLDEVKGNVKEINSLGRESGKYFEKLVNKLNEIKSENDARIKRLDNYVKTTRKEAQKKYDEKKKEAKTGG